MNISCEVMGDLLPLYVDGVASGDTQRLVEEHLRSCPACAAAAERMRRAAVLPENPEIQLRDGAVLKTFKRSWRRKKLAVACTAALAAALLTAAFAMAVQEVAVLHDFFFPSVHMIVRVEEDDVWQALPETITFDSVFFEQEVVNDANSDGPVTLRILDSSGWVAYEAFRLEAGTAAALSSLDRSETYTVEIQAEEGSYTLNFC